MPKEQDSSAAVYTEQPFIGHLADAILLCELAEQLPHSSFARHGALARASMMTAAFCVEAAANALLAPIQAPQFLRDAADAMPILEKFAFVLFAIRPQRTFDRGTKYIQEIRELFDIRNQLVHARPRQRSVTHRDLGDGTFQIIKSDPPSNQLRVPQSPEDWRAVHAVRVLRAVSDFLDNFVLDQCELKREEASAILLSRISLDGRQLPFILPARQKAVLARAMERWPINFRLVRQLTGRDGDDNNTQRRILKLEARYSWSRGGLQVHDNKLPIEVEAPILSTAAVTEAIHKFFIWFEEAQALPFGRSLNQFELWSETQGRLAEYAAFLPESAEPSSPPADERPMGLVQGVVTHFFANGIATVRQTEGTVVITFLLTDGTGRDVTLPESEMHALLHLITMNRRSDWTPDERLTPTSATVHTKGRDYVVAEVEIFAYDPTSRTTFLAYRAESGRKVQINMTTSTAMRLFSDSARALMEGRGARNQESDPLGSPSG